MAFRLHVHWGKRIYIYLCTGKTLIFTISVSHKHHTSARNFFFFTISHFPTTCVSILGLLFFSFSHFPSHLWRYQVDIKHDFSFTFRMRRSIYILNAHNKFLSRTITMESLIVCVHMYWTKRKNQNAYGKLFERCLAERVENTWYYTFVCLLQLMIMIIITNMWSQRSPHEHIEQRKPSNCWNSIYVRYGVTKSITVAPINLYNNSIWIKFFF